MWFFGEGLGGREGREGGECSQSRKAVGKPTVSAKWICHEKFVVAISVLGMHLPKQALSTSLSLSLSFSFPFFLSVSIVRSTFDKIRYVLIIWKIGYHIVSRNLDPETVGEFHRPRCISNEFPPMRCWTLCFSFLVIVRQAEQSGRSLLVCKKKKKKRLGKLSVYTTHGVIRLEAPRMLRSVADNQTGVHNFRNGVHFRDVPLMKALN